MILKPLHQSTNVCHICYQPITTSPELETPCCMTTFHHIHLMEWLQQYESCPHCRFVLTTDIMTTILAHNPLS